MCRKLTEILVNQILKGYIVRLVIVGLVVASMTAEQEVLGSILGSDKVLLAFSIENYLLAVTEFGFVPG